MTEDDDSTFTRENDDTEMDVETTTHRADEGWVLEAQAHYDPAESRDLATVITVAIAEAEDVSITEVLSPRLYEVVDVAGMEAALFGRPDLSENVTNSAVEFRYHEYKIHVEDDGWVTVWKNPDETMAA